MSKNVNQNKQGNRIYHKQTYGSGFSGVMGKVAKIIGIAVLIIVIAGGLYAAWDYNKDSDINTPVEEKTEKIN